VSSESEVFEARVGAAMAAAQTHQWEESGELWEQCAQMSMSHGAWAPASACWEQAGEAWRRGDWATKATDALQAALSQPVAPVDVGAVQTKLAAVLGERGQGAAAVAMARQALLTSTPQARPAAVDTLVGLLQGYGRKVDQRPLVDELAERLGLSSPACLFRRGQLCRLDGDLDGACQAFDEVQRLDGVPGAAAGSAAAQMELAEVGLLRGETAGAVEAFEAGRRLHEQAGRVSLMWRCEVGRVRASVAAGLTVIAPGLAAAQRWARERGLALLDLDLEQALALQEVGRDAGRARSGLERAYEGAMAIGAAPRAGRARLLLAQHVRGTQSEHQRWCSEAQELLSDNVPLRDQARRAADT
jgi:tetratricopeptide (TPR) repeat protein